MGVADQPLLYDVFGTYALNLSLDRNIVGRFLLLPIGRHFAYSLALRFISVL